MKIRLGSCSFALALLALVSAVPLMAQEAAKALAIGGALPMASQPMKNVDGSPLTLSDVKGERGLLVVFTCNACPYAQAWEERIVALGNTYSAQGIGAIAINSNDPAIVPGDGFDQMKELAAKQKMAFPYVVDEGGKVARAFGAARTPEAFLFDASGKLVYHGTIDDNHKEPAQVTKTYLKNALEAVAAGKTVAEAETKALGCGIKFPKA